MNTPRDDSLDPIQDIFQQFEQQAHSDSYSSSHSRSGTSDDEDYPPEMMAFLGMDNRLGTQSSVPAPPHDRTNVYGASFEPYNANGVSPHSHNNTSGSSPDYSYSNGGAPGSATSATFDHMSNAAAYPVYSSADASNSSAYAPYPIHYSAAPNQQQYNNPSFTGQTSSSSSNQPQASSLISPPSSAASSNAGFNNGSNANAGGSFVHNEAISRMIADAQSQGSATPQAQASQLAHSQAQAQSQAAYSSYLSTLNPRQQFGTPNFSEGQLFNPNFSGQDYSATPTRPLDNSSDTETSKRRKVTLTSPVAISSAGRKGSRISHAPHGSPLQYVQPMAINPREDLQNFNFDVKPAGMIEGSLGAPPSQRNSVGIIANAGISDSRQIYTGDENMQDPPSIRGNQRSRMNPPPPLPSKLAKPERKIEKPKKDKRKKGDKDAVERRYRNNINNAIATLRDIVPALRHLKPLPSMPASRRRASQFTLSTAAQAPTPAGLIDGIPAAKTLSKGTILGKSIEYIQYLQGSRVDAGEDIEIFKTVVLELVAGGATLIETFEQRRAAREVEREKARDIARREQALLDDEDNSDEEEDEDEDRPAEVKESGPSLRSNPHDLRQTQDNARRLASVSNLDGLAQLRLHLANGGTTASLPNAGSSHYGNTRSSQGRSSPGGLPPSPVSSSEDMNHSPKFGSPGGQYRTTPQQQPRVLLASFMGLSFVGGLGYDWTYGSAATEASEVVGARAWTGGLVRNLGLEATKSARGALLSSEVVHPSFVTGLVFFGFASVAASLLFLLYPIFVGTPTSTSSLDRQARRAAALASLAELNGSITRASSYGAECKSALKARKQLLKLVGAPTYGFLPALIKEAFATVFRKAFNVGVGSFATWSEEERVECAVAWVRIAEIEATAGVDKVGYFTRCYTFFRLFNLSRCPSWPTTTASTSRATVNAVLAFHLASIGQVESAAVLWEHASNADRKKSDLPLQPWVEIAISTDFDQARAILSAPKAATDPASPSDTLPLLRISEARCEGALRETWAKIFVAVVQTTCPPHSPQSPSSAFATIADRPLLEETTAHVIASTIMGTTVHTLAKITGALCAFYTGAGTQARTMALELAHEARTEGPMARLACASAFFALILDDASVVPEQEATSEVDVLASTTLGWLTVRRQSQATFSTAGATQADPKLHAATLSVRRLLASSVFTDPALVAFCAVPSLGSADLDLETAQEACVDSLTSVTRQAAGLAKEESDSGIEL